MRTIGKKYRNLVRKTTLEVLNSGNYKANLINDTVVERLPAELWNTWEGADQEIRNIIDETIINS